MSETNEPDGEAKAREEAERDRRAANIFLLVAAAVVIGAGLWLMDGLVAARKADDCMSSGRRNCAPIDVPSR
jgi:hypothetical protein